MEREKQEELEKESQPEETVIDIQKKKASAICESNTKDARLERILAMQERERRPTLREHAQAEILMDDDEELEKPVAMDLTFNETEEVANSGADMIRRRQLIARALDEVQTSIVHDP